MSSSVGIRNGPAAMPILCRCGHPESKHTVPGMDGECVADRCRCAALNARPRTTTAPRTPIPIPAGERALVAAWGDVLEVDAAGRGITGHRRKKP